MDKKKSVLNISVSMGFKLITMILTIIVKRFLIQCCGNEVNGLNALYLSIIGFLSVAELGVGSAITFCMYKPIVEKDDSKVSALYHLFRRLYWIIGLIILAAGLLIIPLLPNFAKDYSSLSINLYVTFFIMLLSVVITYFYGAKTALINAYKNNYITTAISSGGLVFQQLLQILVLLKTKSFINYLVCRIVSTLVQWAATELIAHKKYDSILFNKGRLDHNTTIELIRNIKAMFMHKIGSLLVSTFDSIIISIFVGVVVLGEYSNYNTILMSLFGLLKLVFTSLTSIFGHLYAKSNKKATEEYFKLFHLLNFVIGAVFFLGYYAIIDNLISILFSSELVVAKPISFVITLNGFVQFMRQCTLSFREATGTFYNDRWRPLLEGIVNIVLSILLVRWVGVVGVIIATIVTNLSICHVIEPYVLYKYAFSQTSKKFYFKNYGMIFLFCFALVLLNNCMLTLSNQWAELFVNGSISVGISFAVCLLIILLDFDRIKNIKKKF